MGQIVDRKAGAGLAIVAGLALALGRAAAQEPPWPPSGAGSQDALPDAELAEPADDAYYPPTGARLGAETVLARWEAVPRRLARQMIARYGPPDGITPRALSWHRRGPWAAIVVREDAPLHRFPFRHSDWLEQTVSLRVPTQVFGELAAFDGSLLADRTRGQLTARGPREADNVLALNLAEEIASGKRTVEGARAVFARFAGKPASASPYLKSLLFKQQDDAADADQPASDSEVP